MSSEQEIDINVGTPVNSIPNSAPEPAENVKYPGYSQQNTHIDGLADLSDDDLLEAIASSNDQLLIPWEDAILPSRGIYYGWTNGTVKVRAMTQSVEKMLANRRLISSGLAIDNIIDKCCQFQSGTSQDLIVGDRTFLLYYIRCLTYGNLYEFSAKCRECEGEATHSYDLNELYNTVTWANSSQPEPFPVVLPYLSKRVGKTMTAYVRFLRSADVLELSNIHKFNKRLSSTVRSNSPRNRKPLQIVDESESIASNAYKKAIVSINRSQNYTALETLIQDMHSADIQEVRNFLRDNTPGIDTTIIVTCPECNHEMKMELPITDNFFRTVNRPGTGK